MKKSVDSRNELSETLSEMNPVTEEDTVSEVEDTESTPSSLVARLAQGVHPVTAKKVVTASFSDSSLGAQLRQLKRTH